MRGGGLGTVHDHRLALRPVREAARNAPRVPGRRQGPRPDQSQPVVHLPVVRPERPSLLTHTCSVPSDFRKRKAAQQRAAQAAERKRRAAAARKRVRAEERKRRAAERRKQLAAEAAARRKAQQRQRTHDKDRHDYETCEDPYCTRFGCKVYRAGREAGRAEGHADGYSEGFAEGLSADPSARPLRSKGGFW